MLFAHTNVITELEKIIVKCNDTVLKLNAVYVFND